MKKNGYKEITQYDVWDHIRGNPGVTGEAIRQALNAQAERVSYCLSRLKESGHIKGKGQTRAMTYKVTAKKMAA